jgi:dihydroflavonol-4-reductase
VTVVVTGAAGYVGANLVRELLAQGRTVRALVHDVPGPTPDLDCEMVPIDVTEPEGLVYAFDRAEVVYHLAAVISITGDQDGLVPAVNVDGVGHVARAALQAGVGRFVHFSSVHAFDLMNLSRPIDESSGRPPPSHPAYDRSKAAGEARLREVIAEGLDAVILNPTGVFGPEDAAPSRIGQFFRDLVRRRVPALPTGGFNWVDVRDLIDTAIRAETQGVTGENYIVGGRYASIRELADVTCACAGNRAPRINIPVGFLEALSPLLAFLDTLMEGDPMFTREAMHALRANSSIDDGKARQMLGHTPRPLEDTIGDLVARLQGRRSLPAP